ncbi:MAG: hypothetical protein Q9167_001663 [Letrouitia subvulpina]
MTSEDLEEPRPLNKMQSAEPETERVILSGESVTGNELDKKPTKKEDKDKLQEPNDSLLKQTTDILGPIATTADHSAVQQPFYQPMVLSYETPPLRSVNNNFSVKPNPLSKTPFPTVMPPVLYRQVQEYFTDLHRRGKKSESSNLPNMDNEIVALSDQFRQFDCEIEAANDSQRQQTGERARAPSYPTSTAFFDVPSSLAHRQVHLQDILNQHKGYYTRLVVSAFIFSPGGRLLVLRRSKSQHKAFPFCHDLPGGRVNGTDPTILHSVSREVFEETGLRVRRIVREVGNGIPFATPYCRAADGLRWWLKLAFEVEVQEINKTEGGGEDLKQADKFPPVKLNPREHYEWFWALKEDVQTALAENALEGRAGTGKLMVMTKEQGEVMLEAFALHEGAASSSGDQKHESLEG